MYIRKSCRADRARRDSSAALSRRITTHPSVLCGQTHTCVVVANAIYIKVGHQKTTITHNYHKQQVNALRPECVAQQCTHVYPYYQHMCVCVCALLVSRYVC